MRKAYATGDSAAWTNGLPSTAAHLWIRGVLLPACFALTATCGCARADRAAIQSADPNERILAIRAAGAAKDTQAVPLLVDRLEDEDEAVRFFAIIALDRITGRRFGYDYAKPASERTSAVERWRRFVRDGRDAGPGDRSGQKTDAGAKEARASGT